MPTAAPVSAVSSSASSLSMHPVATAKSSHRHHQTAPSHGGMLSERSLNHDDAAIAALTKQQQDPSGSVVGRSSGRCVAPWTRVVAWCLKHHFSRDSVGRRLMFLESMGSEQPSSAAGSSSTHQLLLSLSKTDGSSWKGAPSTRNMTQAPDGGSRACCALQKGQVIVLYGVDAVHDAAVHQRYVEDPSHVVVIRENTADRALIVAIEIVEEADFQQVCSMLRGL
jgi:hypothetical protein